MTTTHSDVEMFATMIALVEADREELYRLAGWAKAGSKLRAEADVYYTQASAYCIEWRDAEDRDAHAERFLSGLTSTFQMGRAFLRGVAAMRESV